MKLIIMTNNAHKLAEIAQILPNNDIISYKTILGHTLDVEETGSTFEENAILKVNAMPAQKTGIVIAEDSGICVDCLDGRPGIHSARYAGENASREHMCQKLLNDVGTNINRSAHYQAVMAIKFPDGHIETVSGRVDGQIAQKMAGNEGFGYDPIFIPEGHSQSFAELGDEIKHRISHRTQALNKLVQAIEKHIPISS